MANLRAEMLKLLVRRGGSVPSKEVLEGIASRVVKGYDPLKESAQEAIVKRFGKLSEIYPKVKTFPSVVPTKPTGSNLNTALIAAGGASMAGLLELDEAEASPVGKPFKTTVEKAIKKMKPTGVSRTDKLLKGTEFMGQRIKGVSKGQGDTRHIILEDNTVYPVTKDVVSDLVRVSETKGYTAAFGVKAKPDQLRQALDSLAYHEARANKYLTKKQITDNYRDYVKQTKSYGATEAPYTLIQRGNLTYTIPKEYASILEKEGLVKILKDLK